MRIAQRASRPQRRRPAARAVAAGRRGSRSSTLLDRTLQPRRSPSRSASRSGSTRSAAPTSSRSASSSTTSVLRVFARRSQTYASNSLIFISWMVGTSLVLLAIAIIFLRNQIRPILRLTARRRRFRQGPRRSRTSRRAARARCAPATVAFHDMRERVERQIEQRTAMLAGVSHDLRTILTRFRLQLALIEDRVRRRAAAEATSTT